MSPSRNRHLASRESAQNLQSLLDNDENSGGTITIYDEDDSSRRSTINAGGSVNHEDDSQSVM